MNSGLAVIIGAVIALIGSAVVPWLTQRSARRAEDERDRHRARADAIAKIVEGWYAIADLELNDDSEEAARQVDVTARQARHGMTLFAMVLHAGEAAAYEYVEWVTVDGIIDAPDGMRITVANRAASQLYRWHWGDIGVDVLEREKGDTNLLHAPPRAG